MTVRRVKQRDNKTGALHEFWMVDVNFTHPDSRRQRIRKVSPVQTRRGAEQYERELRHTLLIGSYGRKEKEVPTLQEFHQEFMSSYVANNNKPSEQSAKRSLFNHHLLPFFGAMRLDRIGAREIERYKAAKLATGLTKKSINNHLACLHKTLSTAVEWEIMATMPRMRAFKAPPPPFDFLTFEEADRLVAAAEGQHRVAVIVALNTGLRHGELLGLRWDDVDLVAGRLVVRRSDWKGQLNLPKSGRQREIPLNPTTLRALKDHRHLRGPLIFCREDGTRLNYWDMHQALVTICRRAGLRAIQWHVLRHSFASHLVMQGVPMKAVQELMGHATMEMTMRYAHLSPDVRRDAVVALERRSSGKVTAKLEDSK